jgi:hypothetical protein
MTDRTTTNDPSGSRSSASTGRSGESGYEGSWNQNDRERARQAADEIKTAAKDAATNTASALRNRLSGELDYRKYRSRQKLNRVAEALRQTGANANQEDDYVARYMERAAQGVDRMAQYLDARNVDEILHDAREMARRRPEVFVGGLFVAGLMLGRFLRSSAQDESYDENWDDYPGYAGSGASPYDASNPYGTSSSYGVDTSSPGTGTGDDASRPGEGRMP